MSDSTTVIIQNLIKRMNSGDDKARAELVGRAQRRLEKLTRKMLKGFTRVNRWEDSADIRQNASLRLWRSLRDVTPANAGEFFRLAATQIRRELIDMARRYFGPEGLGANHQTWVTNPGAERKDMPAAEAPVAETDAAKLAEWTEFHAFVDKLPDEERAVYDLLWYHELTHDEAARLLNISVWTLRRHFRNAKLRLHDWLGSP